MAIGDSSSILLKIKGDSSDAVRATKETVGAMSELESAGGSLSASFAGPMVAASAAAAAGFAAVSIVTIRLTAELFDLSKQAAEYGSKIHDASEKTGLHAETLTALKYAAEQAGSSFEQVTKGIVIFGSEVGKAAEGNDKAAEKMKLLGVTSTDTREALAQAVKTIYDARTQTEQLSLASEAFGRKIGPDLIPLIKDAHGNLDELEKKAKELGITLTDEDAAAADKFGDTLDQLNDQFKGLTNRIGLVFMPVFTDMAEYVSGWLKDNQSEIDEWASRTKTNLTGATSYWQEYYKNLQLAGAGYFEWLAHIREALGPLLGGQIPTGGTFVGQGQIEDIGKSVQQRGADIEARRGSAGLHRVSPDLSDLDSLVKANKDASTKSIKHASDQMRKFFEDIDFTVTDQDRPAGTKVAGTDRISKHSTGEAVDIRTRDKSISEIIGAIAAGLQKGFRFYDERLVKGQPHLHVEANTLKPSTFIDNPALYGGAENLAALKALDAERIARKGGTDILDKAVKAQTDKEKDEAAKRVKIAQDEWDKKGQIGKAGIDYILAQLQRQKDEALSSDNFDEATNIAKQQSTLRIQAIEEEISTLQQKSDLEIDTDKKKALEHQIELRRIALDQAGIEEEGRLQKELNDILDKSIELGAERYKQIKDLVDQLHIAAGTIDDLSTGSLDSLVNDSKGGFDTDAQIKANDQLTDSWHRLKDAMAEAGDVQMAQIDIQQQGLDLIDNMEGALESAIERWLLYGESVGKALKQALAAELAHVAARCAIKAIEATADGFFFLATGDFAASAAAFTAAAYYAAVAVGAGLAAKALAPKQQQKPAGAPSAGAAASQGTRGSNPGQMYSDKEDYTAIIGANAPERQVQTHEVRITLADGLIAEQVARNVRNNGSLRVVIRDVAATT